MLRPTCTPESSCSKHVSLKISLAVLEIRRGNGNNRGISFHMFSLRNKKNYL